MATASSAAPRSATREALFPATITTDARKPVCLALVAVTAKSTHAIQANAFLDFLHTKTAQRIFADSGYRPVVAGVAKPDEFKTPPSLFTIADLGGWSAVNARFFDPQNGLLVDVERKLRVSTQK